MKIVQTLWPCTDNNNINPLTLKGGWLNEQFNWMSWALSCLQLRKYYDEVELVTNEMGKEILIDRLKLPYTKVSVALENETFKNLPNELWTMSKVFTYGMQNEPFLHVDGDIFIWEAFEKSKVENPIVIQNFEINIQTYYDNIEIVKHHLGFVPDAISGYKRSDLNPLTVCNTGVTGGTDFEFFKEYSKTAFEFINKNKGQLPHVLVNKYFCVFVEQYFIYTLAKEKQIPISTLLPPIKNNGDFEMLIDIFNVPGKVKYIHPIGHYKRNEKICRFVDRKLRLYYPDYYYSILNELKRSDVKIYSNLYLTPQFEFHSMGDFLKLSELYKTNQKVLNDNSENSILKAEIEKPENSFARTNYILRKFSKEQLLHSGISLDQIKRRFNSLIKSVNSTEHNTICKDVFNFECARLTFVRELKNDSFIYAQDLLLKEQAEKLLKLESEEELMNQSLTVNKNVKIVNVKWNYCIRQISDVENTFKEVFISEPKSLKIALIPNVQTISIAEYLLGDISNHVISVMQSEGKVIDAYIAVKKRMMNVIDEDTYEKHFGDSIRFLIYHGIIVKPVEGEIKNSFWKKLQFFQS